MDDLSALHMRFQCTLKSSFTVEGIGVHGGHFCKVRVSPLPVDSGVWVAHRKGGQVVYFPALVTQAVPFELATCIGKNGNSSVKTVEHLLSALYGMGVDNALITVEGDEVPIVDGSAGPYVDEIKRVGIHQYAKSKVFLVLSEPAVFRKKGGYIRYVPNEKPYLRIIFRIAYSHPMVQEQTYDFVFTPQHYEQEIARARTFGFLKDAKALHAQGLAQGSSEENAIILTDDGILNKEPLRYTDEFVRHKVCDAIGDLALCGVVLHGTIEYVRSGHSLNAQLSQWIFSQIQKFKEEEYKEISERFSAF